MITYNDSINIGKAICDAVKAECNNHSGDSDIARHSRWASRGTAQRAMDNLWFDILPTRVKEKFSYRTDNFYIACGWPE